MVWWWWCVCVCVCARVCVCERHIGSRVDRVKFKSCSQTTYFFSATDLLHCVCMCVFVCARARVFVCACVYMRDTQGAGLTVKL